MKRYIWDLCKLIVLFICCTFIFYFTLRALHIEYEYYNRYNEPDGPATKVFHGKKWFEKDTIFFTD